MENPIQLVFQDTPEKLRPLAEEAARFLTEVLRELAAAENHSFVQDTRLCRKGRIIEFKDGVREEITNREVWREREKLRFAALLDPHCTQKWIDQRKDCVHATHFPSAFHCLNTGCRLTVTMKSSQKATVWLNPGEGAPYDLSDPDFRYMAERSPMGHGPRLFYSYFEKFRFLLRREAESWKIDEVYVAADCADRWQRDWYF